MPNGLMPSGYRAVLLGQSTTLEGLNAIAPLQESAAEGALMLLRLDFAGVPSAGALEELEAKLGEAGVPPWPGYGQLVYADNAIPSVYIAWQKGLAWTPLIIGILITVLLPTLLGGLIWMLLPESVKEMITTMMVLGVMMLVMSVAMK